jgi:macrolide transport system ATP-binding/permease protein
MGMWSRLRKTLLGARHRDEVDEELQFHLEMAMREAGDDDRDRARRALGNVTLIAEDTRAMGVFGWLESILRDARFGLRQLRRSPTLTLAVIFSLAIGIGANTAIFSLVDAALLKPLPVRDADDLVILEWLGRGFPPGVNNVNGEVHTVGGNQSQGSSVSASIYRQLAASQRESRDSRDSHDSHVPRDSKVFAALIGLGAFPDAAAIAGDTFPAEQIGVQYVSGNFFSGLQVPLAIGRPFEVDDDRLGAEPLVIISHRFWVSRFGRSPGVLDRRVRINNVPARVIGVAPPAFFGLRVGAWPDVYAPLAAKVAFQAPARAGAPLVEDDANWWVRMIGRLEPGVEAETARVRLNGAFRALIPQDVTATATATANAPATAPATPAAAAAPATARAVATPPATATATATATAPAVAPAIEPRVAPDLVTLPGARGFDALGQRDARALRILVPLVAVLFVLVCANVANLLLSRSVGRQRESALRLTLGATRRRLFRQHLIESGVLALIGGAAGLALGYVLAHGIHLLFQSGRDASNAFDLHIDARMLAFTVALSMCAAFVFGLAPALRAARADLGESLKTQSRSVLGGLSRMPRVLVSVQIALSLSALVAAGLLSRSLHNLRTTDVGFAYEHLAYATVIPARAGYTSDRIEPYAARVRDELRRLPGVTHVSEVQTRLLSGGGNHGSIHVPGRPYRRGVGAHMNRVGEDFFATIGIPLLTGRLLTAKDLPPADVQAPVISPGSAQPGNMQRSGGAQAAEAVVVDELFVKQFFPNEQPLGRRFGIGPNDSSRYEIVGVVASSRYNSLRAELAASFYQAYRPGGTVHFAIRTSGAPASLAAAVRTLVAGIDPAVPLTEFHTQAALIDRLLRTERLLGFLSAAFGAIALTLAVVGLTGLLAYAVVRRTNEIGVRMALGARPDDVTRMVLRDALWMLAAGMLLGVPCAYALAKTMSSELFNLQPLDPATLALALATLLIATCIAAWLPAARAARIDPVSALRQE